LRRSEKAPLLRQGERGGERMIEKRFGLESLDKEGG